MAVNTINRTLDQSLFVNTGGVIDTSQIISEQGLGTPTISSAVAGDTQVTLTWSAVDGATNYDVRIDGSTILSDVGSSPYAVTSLTNDTEYDFEVRATDGESDGEWSAAVSRTPTAVVAPTYTPFYTASFDGTPDSSSISEMSANFTGTQYSDDIAGPHDEAIVLRNFLAAGAPGSFGGTLTSSPGVTLESGDRVWCRGFFYFPTAFCAGHSTNPDGWTNIKWFRLQWQTDSSLSRMTLQLGNFTDSGCSLAAESPTLRGFTFEGINGVSNQFFETELVIPRDQWVAIQFEMYIHPTEGYMRGWVDDDYAGEIGPIDTVPDNTGDGFTRMVLGDYWNGYGQQDNTWYVQDIICTKDTPNTTDSGARNYIAPATAVGDFV